MSDHNFTLSVVCKCGATGEVYINAKPKPHQNNTGTVTVSRKALTNLVERLYAPYSVGDTIIETWVEKDIAELIAAGEQGL